jgi:hypothetical protein
MRAAASGLEFTVKPNGAYRLVQKGERRCLIELVEVTGQEPYCARLEKALGLPPDTVPRMPAHVTLFTEAGGRGIALYSAEELAALSAPADLTLDPNPWSLDGNGAILAP